MAASNLVVAMTGASGAAYGLRLLEVALNAGRTVHLVISPSGADVIRCELDRHIRLEAFEPRVLFGQSVPESGRLLYHDYRDFRAGIASGSFPTAGMAICPCSMATVASIAHGISDNLINRAADVHLKERRKLVLVPQIGRAHV